MATRTVKLIGKASWCKVFAENRDLKGFEKYRYDPMMSMKHKDVKDNVEKVMISKFVEKVQKKFPDPEREKETLKKQIRSKSPESFLGLTQE